MDRACELEHIVNSVTLYVTKTGKIVGVYRDKVEALKASWEWGNMCSMAVNGFSAYPWFEPVPPPPRYAYVVSCEQEHRVWEEAYESYCWESSWEIVRVFSTKEKAEAYMKQWTGGHKVEEVPLDDA